LIKNHVRVSGISKKTRSRYLHIVFIVLVLVNMLSAITISSAYRYIVVQLVLMMVLLSYYTSSLFVNSVKRYSRNIVAFLTGMMILVLTPNVENGWIFSGKQELKVQVNRRIIDTIQLLDITQNVNMLDMQRGFFVYLNDNYKLGWDFWKDVSFQGYMDKYSINMVVVTLKLRKYCYPLSHNKEFNLFLKNYETWGFMKIEVPGTDAYLLVKKHLLKE